MRAVPVPEIVQRRAWECAIELRETFSDAPMTLEQRVRAEVMMRQGPEAVGWADASWAFETYAAIAGERV